MDLAGIIVPVGFFALVVLVVYFTAKFNYQTKKAILEKGGKIEEGKKKFPVFEIGLTILGIGLGLAVAVIPRSFDLPEESKELLMGACILFFGGLGLTSAFFIKKRVEKQQ